MSEDDTFEIKTEFIDESPPIEFFSNALDGHKHNPKLSTISVMIDKRNMASK